MPISAAGPAQPWSATLWTQSDMSGARVTPVEGEENISLHLEEHDGHLYLAVRTGGVLHALAPLYIATNLDSRIGKSYWTFFFFQITVFLIIFQINELIFSNICSC